MPDNHENEYDWIELAVKAGSLIGLNPVRTRWKLRAWVERMENRRRAVSSTAREVTREHKTCPKCGGINNPDQKVCLHCGAKLRSRPVEIIYRFLAHFELGLSAETFIAVALAAAYGLTAIEGKGSLVSGPGIKELLATGANFYPLSLGREWWRLWTSVFIHANLWHIGFNVYALIYVMPLARQVYGGGKSLAVFSVAGLAGSLSSAVWAASQGYPVVSVGASGAISGIIGLLLVWGHRDQTASGIAIRNSMARWVFYILLFGFFVGADQAAHIGGWVCGGVLALALPTSLTRGEGAAGRVAGAVSALAVLAGALAVACLALTTLPLK